MSAVAGNAVVRARAENRPSWTSSISSTRVVSSASIHTRTSTRSGSPRGSVWSRASIRTARGDGSPDSSNRPISRIAAKIRPWPGKRRVLYSRSPTVPSRSWHIVDVPPAVENASSGPQPSHSTVSNRVRGSTERYRPSSRTSHGSAYSLIRPAGLNANWYPSAPTGSCGSAPTRI